MPAHSHSVLDRYDVLLLDLDGTIFAGGELIQGADTGIAGRPKMYITNNASRSPQQVAEHLSCLGIPTKAEEVITSAQAACSMARQELGDEGAVKALVVGSDSFKQLAADAGFDVVNSADDQPDIVLQGHNPETGWAQLSEAALSINNGARYFASNLDTTLPSERGFLVGNGSMVAAVTSATGVKPASAGKPEPAMFYDAQKQTNAQNPLAVGDRLDTDIAGGIAAGMDTFCVLTGVATPKQLLDTEFRPTYIAPNLVDEVPQWTVTQSQNAQGTPILHLQSGESGSDAVNNAAAIAALAPQAWTLQDEGHSDYVLTGSDELAQNIIDSWGLDPERLVN